jgi:hypothetical protein
MILNIFEELEKLSDKFKNFIIDNDSPFLMIGLFLGLLFIFMIGWDIIHKNDR